MHDLRLREDLIPNYRLEQRLGRGSIGEVWRATAPGGGATAMKIVNVSGKAGFKEFRAVQRIKKIRHANLLPITALWLLDAQDQVLEDTTIRRLEQSFIRMSAVGASADERPQTLVMAMPLADENLADRLEACRRNGSPGIPPLELASYLFDAARGIDYLNEPRHDLGHGLVAIQHCDIKPQNIMLQGNSALICDFGLARVLGDTRTTSHFAGTPAYVAPECIDRNHPSHTSDQYSLALSYFEMRTGHLPFEAHSVVEAIRIHLEGRLELSALPRSEQSVIAKATALDPEQRFATCLEMAEALRDALTRGSLVVLPGGGSANGRYEHLDDSAGDSEGEASQTTVGDSILPREPAAASATTRIRETPPQEQKAKWRKQPRQPRRWRAALSAAAALAVLVACGAAFAAWHRPDLYGEVAAMFPSEWRPVGKAAARGVKPTDENPPQDGASPSAAEREFDGVAAIGGEGADSESSNMTVAAVVVSPLGEVTEAIATPPLRSPAEIAFEAATLARQEGDWERAAELLAGVEPTDPLADQVRELRAESLFQLARQRLSDSQYAEAAAFAADALATAEGGPVKDDWLVALGEAMFFQEKYADVVSDVGPHVESITDAALKAEAIYLVGTSHAREGDHDEAVRLLLRVVHGFGGDEAAAAVQVWQAKSAYETARSFETRLESATGMNRFELIAEARNYYSLLVERHPTDQLTASARERLQSLGELAARERDAEEKRLLAAAELAAQKKAEAEIRAAEQRAAALAATEKLAAERAAAEEAAREKVAAENAAAESEALIAELEQERAARQKSEELAARLAAAASEPPPFIVVNYNEFLRQGDALYAKGKFREAIVAYASAVKAAWDEESMRAARQKRGAAYVAGGWHEYALVDYSAVGRETFPLSVRTKSAELEVSGKRTGSVKQGDVLEVSRINGDFYWVVSVNGSDVKQGWVRSAAFRDPPKPAANIARQNNYSNQGGYSNHAPPSHDWGGLGDLIDALHGGGGWHGGGWGGHGGGWGGW